jgi:hypothetical protein
VLVGGGAAHCANDSRSFATFSMGHVYQQGGSDDDDDESSAPERLRYVPACAYTSSVNEPMNCGVALTRRVNSSSSTILPTLNQSADFNLYATPRDVSFPPSPLGG